MSKRRPAAKNGKSKPRGGSVPSAPQFHLRALRISRIACAGTRRAPRVTQTIAFRRGASSEGSDTFSASVDCALSGKTDDGEEGVRVEATFSLLYELASGAEAAPQAVAETLPQVAIADVWPYWREFVRDMTLRMGLPSLRLPFARPDFAAEETAVAATQ